MSKIQNGEKKQTTEQLELTDVLDEGRHIRLALDLVEPGDGSDDAHGRTERYSKTLPEGITSKELYGDVVRIAWPSLVELFLTQLASMVDLMMVGSLGPWAITSVGLATQPRFIVMTLFMAMNTGAMAMVARHKGAGQYDRANAVLRQALTLNLLLSLITSLAGFVFAENLIAFMGAEDAITLAGGTVYLKIAMVGMFSLALTSTITAALRGVGNTKAAMIYNLISNGVNVVFNYLFIGGNFGFPRLEVAGASLATVMGQVVAMLMAFYVVIKGDRFLKLNFRGGRLIDRESLLEITRIGIPAMGEQFVMRVGMVLYSKTVAGLGTIAFATHNICMNVQSLSFMNGQAMAVSATSLVGQSLGKKRPDMAQAYASRTRKVGMVISFGLTIIFMLFSRQIVMLYTDDITVINQGARILWFVALVQPFQASQFILAGGLRGAGDTKSTAIISFLTVLLVRPPLAMLLIKLGLGLDGAWIALAVDQLLRSGFVLLRFNSGRWKAI